MKWPIKITVARLAAHDFNRSLRVWRKHIPPTDIFKSLVAERARTLATALRTFLLATVGALWLSAAKPTLDLKISLIELSVPAAYVNFAVAMFIVGTTVNITSYFMLNEFVRVASNKLFGIDAPWAHAAMFDGGSVWSNGLLNQFRFFKSRKAHQRYGVANLYLANLPFVIIAAVIYWTVFSTGLSIFVSEKVISISTVLTLITYLLLLYSLAHIVSLFIPFAFDKNLPHVRWGFLTRMYRRNGQWPPRVDTWLSPKTN